MPDMEVPVSETRGFKFFEKKTVQRYAEQFGWKLITKDNMKDIFMEMVETMTMSYSYKPVFMLAFLKNMDENASARLDDVTRDFAAFYEKRKDQGLQPEKKNCIFTKGGYTAHDVEHLILSMPFKRFEDMHVMHHAKHLGIIQIYKTLVRQLTEDDYQHIRECSEKAIERYFTE